VTGRVASLFAALALVPSLARSEAAAVEPADQQPSASSGTNPGGVVVPPKIQERTDFQLTLTTLEALRKKGMMTEDEYNAALRDLISVGQRAATAPTFVVGRFVTTLYGYLEGDVIHDTQRVTLDSYGGHPTLILPGSQRGDTGRTVFSSRGTRLGIRFAAPEVNSIRVRANFEMDFVGNQPGNPGLGPPTQGEASFLDNPTPRIRHALLQVDNPIVTVWIGQTWNVMAFAAAYLPTSVQPQGLPGQLFGRNPQVRLSHLFDASAFSVEVAAAALRPPQFDAEVPDLQAGIKFNINGWTGVQSIGSTATTISPASIAVTGATRNIKMATSTTTNARDSVQGNVIAVDTFIPVVPAKERGGLALSLIAEGAVGTGFGDLYTGLTGGANIGRPATIAAAPVAPAVDPYTAFQDIDAGIAGFNRSGKLDTIDWRNLLVGAQLSYGKVILAGNFSSVYSDNVNQFVGGLIPAAASVAGVWNHQSWWNANLIVDPWPGVRLGIEFARTLQRRAAGPLANNSRVFFGSFFLF